MLQLLLLLLQIQETGVNVEKHVWGIETYCNVFIPYVWICTSLFLNGICI